MHLRRSTILMLLLAGLTGCVEDLSPEPSTQAAPAPGVPGMQAFLTRTPTIEPAEVEPSDAPEGSPAAATRTIYMIYLRIGMVEVPTGMASGSERLWSYLDEEPVAMYSTSLGLNGFRIGLGRPDSWHDLDRVLGQMAGRQFRARALQLYGGQPGSVVIKGDQPVQTIFTYFSDQTLSGADYPPGDNILTAGADLDRSGDGGVIVTALPQVRSTRKQSVVEMRAGVPTFTTRSALFPFRPLTFQVAIPEGYFLVIGPGIQSRRPSSVAHHFLTVQREGIEYETLLIVHPTVVPVQINPQASQTPG
jgi:hypothetical protein